jgi:hypothetical protein
MSLPLSMSLSLSIFIIARNEADRIAPVIAAVAALSDDIIGGA